jgi:hypothetical protein
MDKRCYTCEKNSEACMVIVLPHFYEIILSQKLLFFFTNYGRFLLHSDQGVFFVVSLRKLLFFFMSYGRFLLHSDEGSFVLFFCE